MSLLDGLKLNALQLKMHWWGCFDLSTIWFVIVFKPGELQSEYGLFVKLAWQKDSIAGPSAQPTPSRYGIVSLYTPYLSVVLLTEKLISSVVVGEFASSLHSIWISAPDPNDNNWTFKIHERNINCCKWASSIEVIW